jgi:peptide/nickel transport system permease protein
MTPLIGKEKRKVYTRKIKGFWEEFSRKKIGLFGLGLVAFYVVLALFAPWLAPYDPMKAERVAQDFAMPSWVTILPQYGNLSTTERNSLYWSAQQEYSSVTITWGRKVSVQYKADTMELVDAQVTAEFPLTMEAPPNLFYIKFLWAAENLKDVAYSLKMRVLTPDGESYTLWNQKPLETAKSEQVYMDSTNPFLPARAGFPIQENMASIIFPRKGQYTALMSIQFNPKSAEAEGTVTFQNFDFTIPGHVHGILGCDYIGADILSQVIWGAQISLMIGILAALASSAIGIIVGVITGYLGGVVDEIVMRIVDILLCLPLLPLLLVLVSLFGKSVFYIVLFVAIFGWQGLARMIRSSVLSLRETAFIECAKASGASRFYIMIKHLIPNVLPIAFASLVLGVPAAILFEAALSFLGFGDPRVPTWGKMLHQAFGFGAFTRMAWWWLIPPGLAITTLCLAFVFMGHALDEVVNPRLRRRR